MANTKAWNEELMDSIAGLFQECIDITNEIITETYTAKTNLSNSYNGHANDLVAESCDKLKEHSELLLSCCNNIRTYIVTTKIKAMENDEIAASGLTLGSSGTVVLGSSGS